MIAPGDKAQASYDAVSARADSCGPPRNVPAPRAVPLPGTPKQASPAPRPSGAVAATRSPSAAPPPAKQQPKLLDRLREALRSRHYSRRTEQSYCQWACLPRRDASRRRQVKRFIFFHNVRHPAEMAEPEINGFLTHLATKGKVSASTQNQALSALLFLYRHVLGRRIGDLGDVVRARRPSRLPVVLTRQEVKAVLGQLKGDRWLMASLMYGAGLRLMPACRARGAGRECLRLRVQDVDLASNQIVVRDGKGFKDRLTMLPEAVKPPLQNHLAAVKTIHERDLADGYGRVQMPYALARKYANAAKEWGWQFLFPQERRWVNPRTGEQGRHHADPSILQRVVKAAVSTTGLAKHATCHTLRHSGVYPAFCGTTHLLEDGYLSAVPSTAQAGDIRTIQELLGHRDVKTTMIYCAVRKIGDSPSRTAQSGGESEEGRRPAPLGRARGEGRGLAACPACPRAFPANEAARANV